MNKMNTTTKTANCGTQLPKRHIVTWSQEEDDILRDQIRVHGTDNWAIIASKFKDKTTRQCRRRWYTYLNSDFKKGGWSPEEDMLLCEAQKIFGNRWTEIAKVVSGRTDNAVKNRFSTLCKKRARHEALAKENNTCYINLNNKRVIFQNAPNEDGLSETRVPHKKLRWNHISDTTGDLKGAEMPQEDTEKTNLQPRPPFAVLVQNFDILRDLPTQNHANTPKEVTKDEAAISDMIQGMYLKKDDAKIIALKQQAELLSSLALKVNTENTDQSLENAWKILQDFLNQSKEVDMITLGITDMDFQLENSKDLVEDLKGSKEGNRPYWRHSDLYAESPDSSEYSTGSTVLTHVAGDKPECNVVDVCAIHQETEAELHPTHMGHSNADSIPSCDDLGTDDRAVCLFSSNEFNSPFQVTPLFRSLASGIPTPQFSESERHFLLKTLGVESASPDPSTKGLQTPPCKRALIHSL